ncbi:MAG: hypothetical protein Q7T33_02250 [Dehalococcoidia bacterium]|nr:hypothetical protein [Dehalococcoidia bacterium]
MRITGPERYKLTFDATTFVVTCAKGTPRFSGIATSKKPKLYIASVDEKPIYVGVTKQSIRNRLRFGWNAEGQGGYYGYAWRHGLTEALLDVWCHDDAPPDNPVLDIETVEAEVVFLVRCAGQWPMYQTEIHFHPSSQVHRDVATTIVARYALRPNSSLNTDDRREL